MIITMNKGRPKQPKELEELNFTTFQNDITIFRNSLIDSLEDEDNDDQEQKLLTTKFLNLNIWRQNLFIVYLLNKDKRNNNNKFSFKALADLLQVERGELMREIKSIKKELL